MSHWEPDGSVSDQNQNGSKVSPSGQEDSSDRVDTMCIRARFPSYGLLCCHMTWKGSHFQKRAPVLWLSLGLRALPAALGVHSNFRNFLGLKIIPQRTVLGNELVLERTERVLEGKVSKFLLSLSFPKQVTEIRFLYPKVVMESAYFLPQSSFQNLTV